MSWKIRGHKPQYVKDGEKYDASDCESKAGNLVTLSMIFQEKKAKMYHNGEEQHETHLRANKMWIGVSFYHEGLFF